MARHKVTGDQAFALLVAASQRRDVKLRELAEHLVRSGALHSASSEPPPGAAVRCRDGQPGVPGPGGPW